MPKSPFTVNGIKAAADSGLTVVASAGATVHGVYGDLTIYQDGTYTYTPNASFDALQAGSNPSDVFTYQVTDNDADASAQATLTINITGANDSPVVNAHTGTLSYTENQAPAAIDTVLTVSDVDNANLSGATVSITGNFHSGEDVLGFSDQNGIHGSYAASTGVLTLTGSATVAQYQAALEFGNVLQLE